VSPNPPRHGAAYAFIEPSALQVEHTVTEESPASTSSAYRSNWRKARPARHRPAAGRRAHAARTAVQLRINMEKIEADGTIKPSGGT